MTTQRRNNPTPDGRRADAQDSIQQRLAALGSQSHAEQRARQVVPWISTLALHAGIVAMGFIITWSVVQYRAEEEPVQIVADFHTMTYEPVVELKTDRNVDESRDPMMDDMSLLEFDAPLPDPFREQTVQPLSAAPEPLAPSSIDFSTTTVEGSASFLGVSASNAQKIVYVIDASGSMIAYLQFIIHELSKSLDALSEQQSFGIVFFQRNQALAVPPVSRLMPARQVEKTRSLQWIKDNVVPAGRSNPINAIEHALRLRPDVIFILSVNITGAGHYEVDQRDLLARLNQLNPANPSSGQRQTQINCIQFLDPDPLDTLRIIAEEHGGEGGYKFLSRQELGLTSP